MSLGRKQHTAANDIENTKDVNDGAFSTDTNIGRELGVSQMSTAHLLLLTSGHQDAPEPTTSAAARWIILANRSKRKAGVLFIPRGCPVTADR